jgi:hypothetical protein
MVQLYSTATEYLANALTFSRGSAADVIEVGVYHSLNPLYVPSEADFVQVTLVEPGDPLAQGNVIDVLSLVGPGPGADLALAPGDWQRWVLVKTNTEVIIRKVDVVTVL